MSEKGLHAKLIDIQQNLKAPKSEYNEFGGFAYRNIESIEQAVKPLLKEHGLTLRFVDDIVAVGTRVYVKSTAILSDGENTIENAAYAREAESKTKMDDSQITGASSSYARKYAAGGLFLIDNEKDADSMNNTKAVKREVPKSKTTTRFATDKQIQWMRDTARKVNDQLGGNEETDKWIESVLTIPPQRVPVFKVEDAVNKLMGGGEPEGNDTVITDIPDTINLDDLPY